MGEPGEPNQGPLKLLVVGSPYAQRDYKANRMAVIVAARGRCQLMLPGCKGVATTADHIAPVSAGGSNDVANLRAACRHCNSRLGVGITNERRHQRRLGSRSRRW